jgi:hypothetical protein
MAQIYTSKIIWMTQKKKISSKNFLGQNECHSASYKTSVVYNLFYFGRINFLKTKKSFDFLKKKMHLIDFSSVITFLL